MSMPETLKMVWWKWWSNPLINIHPEHLERIPFAQNKDKPMEYYQLLQIRNILELEDLPGPTLDTKPELIALATATAEQLGKHLFKLCVLSMDTMIIHARPQEWESKFGITSADTIRQTIELYRSIPTRLSKWQFSAATLINQDDNRVLNAQDRAQIGLGLILKSFFPAFYKRWAITTAHPIYRLINQIDPLEESTWNEIIEWINPELNALYEEIASDYQEPDMQIEDDLLEDIYTPLDVDALYGGTNHA
jgi:hypothetical protein